MPDSHESPDNKTARLLIIRFSSFGDIVQALGVPAAFRKRFPDAEIDWLVRDDFRSLVEPHPLIRKVHTLDRRQGLRGLVNLAWHLAQTGDYTHVYDAHRNLRSAVVRTLFGAHALIAFFSGRIVHIASRPKHRLRRWLYFRFRLDVLPRPFRGAESFLWPLKKWDIDSRLAPPPQFFAQNSVPDQILRQLKALPEPRIALVPSAAWKMKRWPMEHWKRLMELIDHASFVLLGGPDDDFIRELENAAPGRVLNLAGRLKLSESAALLSDVQLVIANDTGLLHVADQMGRPTLALIGPTAFGYTSQPNSENLEIDLGCKPCSKDGRGRCRNSVYQRCLVELSPEYVAARTQEKLGKDR